MRQSKLLPTSTVIVFCALGLIAPRINAAHEIWLIEPHVTLAANFDAGHRKTQFFVPDHNVFVGQWDARLEVWLPPHKDVFSWGPYLRLGGIAASEDEPWENAWLAGPGGGLQIYPFSSRALKDGHSTWGKLLGPVRLFAETNRTHYWGAGNAWRPKKQNRIGSEYWRATYVNDLTKPWWLELWAGYWRQSSNEFAADYDTWILATSLRTGARIPSAGTLSALTPYVVVESSSTRNKTYYWENRLSLGGGLRFAPALIDPKPWGWVNRFVVYGEYIDAAKYYHQRAPRGVPGYDVRFGVSLSVGEWFSD